MNCFTSIDAMALNGAGGLALAGGALGWMRDLLRGRSRVQRRQTTWDDNAAFVAALGLEPSTVLGSRPRIAEVPAEPVGVPVLAFSPNG